MGSGRWAEDREFATLFGPLGLLGPVERTRVAICAVLIVAVVLSSGLVALRFIPPFAAPGGNSPPVGIAFDVTHVGGKPEMNTTEYWVARITHVDTNESLSSYRATLLRNGTVLVESVTVKPGQLGDSTHPVFEFFESGSYCSPTPCPPPEGPDGNLSVYDYFRISFPDPGTAYTVRLIWGATGNTVGEIVIDT